METLQATYSAATGIGAEAGVMRRDPSDIIKVGDLYYVWYSKGSIAPGYDATVWYATSPDGHQWTEKGMALASGGLLDREIAGIELLGGDETMQRSRSASALTIQLPKTLPGQIADGFRIRVGED
jgi:hypothetical protein